MNWTEKCGGGADNEHNVTQRLLFVLTVQTALEIDGAGHRQHEVVKGESCAPDRRHVLEQER